ncbi:MAG: 3-oxoacyl-[acyl-carrier protein] reductase [Planctomycetota bacterium]|jgi:3-oxoacyl-[acyl-carrier protein] reductase
MSESLKNKTALVTGASTGLGLSIACELARRGARVALNYANNEERAGRAFVQLEAAAAEGSGAAFLVRADATTEEGVNSMVESTTDAIGTPDIVVLNATCEQPQLPIEEYDWAFYQRMLDFFIKSPYLLTRALLPHMKAQRYGRIINIGSEVFDRGLPNFSAYTAAKGGQRGWNRSMATELAPWQITVNMVSPGWIPVERHENDPQEMKDGYLAGVPMGRWGVPQDIAEAVAYLAGDGAAFVTGQTLIVNGGNTVN